MGRTKSTKNRDKVKNPGLKKNKFSKIKQEYHDIDYAHKLDSKTAAWLNNFMEEDLGARLNHPGKKIYKTDADRKACYQRNNERNRDIYSNWRASGRLLTASSKAIENYLDSKMEETILNPEDEIIEALDRHKIGEFVDNSDKEGDDGSDNSG